MTENADVEWLRRMLGSIPSTPIGALDWLGDFKLDRLTRLLAHIDELEADIEDYKKDALRRALCNDPEPDRRPTIHEIAARIMAALLGHDSVTTRESLPVYAEIAYDAAEALVAEGRRRDEIHR